MTVPDSPSSLAIDLIFVISAARRLFSSLWNHTKSKRQCRNSKDKMYNKKREERKETNVKWFLWSWNLCVFAICCTWLCALSSWFSLWHWRRACLSASSACARCAFSRHFCEYCSDSTSISLWNDSSSSLPKMHTKDSCQSSLLSFVPLFHPALSWKYGSCQQTACEQIVAELMNEKARWTKKGRASEFTTLLTQQLHYTVHLAARVSHTIKLRAIMLNALFNSF